MVFVVIASPGTIEVPNSHLLVLDTRDDVLEGRRYMRQDVVKRGVDDIRVE